MPTRRTQPKASSHLTPRWHSYAFLLLNAVTWGAALIIVKPIFEYTTPFRYLFYRYVIAIMLSLPLLWHYGKAIQKTAWKELLGKVTLLELIGTTLALSLLYFGLEKTSAIEASLLVNTTPIFTILAGVIFLKERQESNEWLGLLLAVFGTVLLTIWPWFMGGKTFETVSVFGNFLIILQNIATAIYFILAKKWYNGWPKLLLTTLSFYVGAITFGLLSFGEVGWQWNILTTTITSELSQPIVWWVAGYMALFASIIGLTAYIKGQDGIEASEASLFSYLQPLVYLPMGVIFLGEMVQGYQLAALGLIAVGVWMAERRTTRSATSSKPSKKPSS